MKFAVCLDKFVLLCEVKTNSLGHSQLEVVGVFATSQDKMKPPRLRVDQFYENQLL